jgi:hypothetical protein
MAVAIDDHDGVAKLAEAGMLEHIPIKGNRNVL